MRDDTEDYKERVRKAREGRSPLVEDEEEARQIIEEDGRAFLEGERLSAKKERRLRNALALVRRHEKISADEIRLRARRGWIG